MIDTHAHVFSDQFDGQRDEMLERARSAGVHKVYMPNINGDSIKPMMDLAKQYPDFLKPMLGLHPCYVGDDWADHMDQIEAQLNTSKVVGIGETGLDYYWDTSHVKEQKACLERHVKWALAQDLPIILHSRSAIDDTIEMMQAAGPNIRGIFHCFTGTIEQARQVLEMNFKIGIGGIVTFKNAGLNKVVSSLPLDSLVLETDAPYLAPHPHRSKKNEPSYLPLVAQKIAEVHRVDVEQVIQQTNKNAEQIFRSAEKSGVEGPAK